MPIAHVFGPTYAGLEHKVNDHHTPSINPFRPIHFKDTQDGDSYRSADQEVVYIPLDDDKLLNAADNFIVPLDQPGNVYYVFEDTQGITKLEDESTVDPYQVHRDGKLPWENLPRDSNGKIIKDYLKYVPPITIKQDKRPLRKAKENRENEKLVLASGKSRKDEYYIPEFGPNYGLVAHEAVVKEPASKYTI